MSTPLLTSTSLGLYCAAGDFYVDPWRPVPRAVVTHAHSDHACWGCESYLTSDEGEHVLRARIGLEAKIETLPFGRSIDMNGVKVSLHPAGHILGSAQIRIEHLGEIWVASGDYKVDPDATCSAFESILCHTFISESTFALPIYRWPRQVDVFAKINDWWRANASQGKASMLYGYALGKAQRMLAGLDPSIGPIYTHGAVEKLNEAYRKSNIILPKTHHFRETDAKGGYRQAIVLAPPSAHGTPWAKRFAPSSSGFASGWMTIRGTRRRRAIDRGFILSDHADWPGLLDAIEATGADQIILTHGYTAVLGRWLTEKGKRVESFTTEYRGEVESLTESVSELEPNSTIEPRSVVVDQEDEDESIR